MRRTLIQITTVFVVMGFCTSSLLGQESEHLAIDDAVLAEFRELVCDAAIDDQSPIHDQAVGIVVNRNYNDPRFDDFVRQPFGGQSKESSFNTAMNLMTVSSLPNGEKVQLLLDSLATWNEEYELQDELSFIGWSAQKPEVTRLNQSLVSMKKELARELEKRLAVDEPPTILVAAAELSEDESLPLVPLLLAVAKKGSPQRKRAAVTALDHSILLLHQHAQAAIAGPSMFNAKTIAYATKIIARYDTDADQAITAAEWSKMLVDPSPADTNQDGKVTVSEYASWMEKRSSR